MNCLLHTLAQEEKEIIISSYHSLVLPFLTVVLETHTVNNSELTNPRGAYKIGEDCYMKCDVIADVSTLI